MNRKEFLTEVKREAQVNASAAVLNEILWAITKVIQKEVITTGRCQVRGLGVFKLAVRKGRPAHNILTGERVEVPDMYLVRFTPENQFKRTVKAMPVRQAKEK